MTDPVPSLTEQALADLDEIWDTIAEDHPRAANRFLDRFHEAARIHAQFPESGRGRDEIRPGCGSFLVKPYVAFYRISGGSIAILRVLHGRRDLPRIMRQMDQ